MPWFVKATLILAVILRSPSAGQDSPADPMAQARGVLAAITANDFPKVEAQFTEPMKTALPPGRLAAMWKTLATKAGPFKRCAADARLRTIDDKNMVITACEFERATFDIQFAFDSAGRISGLAFRPAAGSPAAASTAAAYTLPPYANRSSYAEEETTIGSPDWRLPATLTVPAGDGPFPAVVLVHGSGPNDRDETLGANKPFKDLAAGLASRGIAVLRYDKRTKVHAARMAALTDVTVKQEVVDDALEAVRFLRAQSRIDQGRVFVLGHSLGAGLIPRIGAADSTVAGWIVMAGPARPLEEAITAQSRYLAMADGTITAEEQQGLDRAAALAASVHALTPEDAREVHTISGVPASYWLDLRGYDPPAAAARVKAPMLILQGERDYQVTLDEFAKWKAALGSRRDVTFHTYPALNHLFIPGTGPSLPAEYQVPGHVAEDVIRDIAAWIRGPR